MTYAPTLPAGAVRRDPVARPFPVLPPDPPRVVPVNAASCAHAAVETVAAVRETQAPADLGSFPCSRVREQGETHDPHEHAVSLQHEVLRFWCAGTW